MISLENFADRFQPVIGWLSGLEYSLSGLVLILFFVIWRLTRHQECSYVAVPEGEILDLLPTVAGLTHGTVTDDNTISLIRGPEFFEAVISEMARAKKSIHLETFLWEAGKASSRITAALCEAAGRGVKVRIIADARGSSGIGRETRESLKNAGCEFHLFHPWKLMNLGRFNVRDHRKIMVIDGETAFVGGHCIADAWLEDQGETPVISDVSARIQGSVVHHIQSAFSENWVEADCGFFVTKEAFPPTLGDGTARAHVAYLRPDGCPSAVLMLHRLAIALSEEKLRIQNPYFLPDPEGAEGLMKAARRGVDVRIMVPAISATDSFFVTYAGHFMFDRLLESGIRIYEYQPTLLHQKTITVDGKWAGIGSSNFDDRSFKINDEITVGIADPAVAAQLDAIFDEDLEKCREISLEEWRKRGFCVRVRERFFYFFNEQF